MVVARNTQPATQIREPTTDTGTSSVLLLCGVDEFTVLFWVSTGPDEATGAPVGACVVAAGRVETETHKAATADKVMYCSCHQ